MSLPAQIVAANQWPDNYSYVTGPHQASGALYVILPDKTSNVLRCYYSTDGGLTWTEADSAHAPACSTASGAKGANVVLSGTTLYAFQILSTSSINIVPFNTATNLWGTAISGPTITISTVYRLWGAVRSDGSIVIFYNGATDAIMATPYQRVKVHYRTTIGSWFGPYDAVGSANSPPANTAPGTQTHYYCLGAVLGASNRVLLLYSTLTTGDPLSCRVFTSSNVFTTTVGIPGTSVTSAQYYVVGQPTLYTDSGLTKIAIPVVHSSTGLDLARCDTATAETSTNWTVENTTLGVPEYSASDCAAVCADSKKLWLMFSRAVERTLAYSNDAGAATWAPLQTWKDATQVRLTGFSIRNISTGLGVVYCDILGQAAVMQSQHDTDVLISYSDTNYQNRAYQSFIAPNTCNLTSLRIRLRSVGTVPANIYVRVMADNGGAPGTTQIGSDYTNGQDAIGTTDGWIECTPVGAQAALAAGTPYWLLILNTGTGNSTVNYFVTRASSTDLYANGNLALGTSTGTVSQQPSMDLAFMLYTSTASGPRVRYDQLDIYAVKVSAPVGSNSTIIDLGDPPPPSYTVYADVGDNADPAGTVEVDVQQSWDGGAWMPVGSCGPSSVQNLDGVTIQAPARNIQVTTIVTGSDSVAGVSGIGGVNDVITGA